MKRSPINSRSFSVVLVLGLVAAFIGLSLVPAGAQPIEVSIPDIQETDSPNGDSPLLGETVTVDGVVTALDPADGGLDGYFIQEAEGGPWSGVYVSDASGNRPAVGDLIQVTGRVDEVMGLTSVTNLREFTVVSNGNPLPAPRGVTASVLQTNGEPWEGVLVALHGVTVISENPDAPEDLGEWVVADATDGSVRVGHLLSDNDYTPVEGDNLLMVRGLVYFSFDAFKIEPLSSADILEQADYTTVYDIQRVPDEAEDNASPLDGQRVTTAGVVTAAFSPSEDDPMYIVEDVRGGPWSGVWVREDAAGDVPAVGAHVELMATVREYFGRTELFEIDENSVSVHSLSNALPAVSEVSTQDIATGQPHAESYEGVLIQVGPVTVTNANLDAPDDFGEWLIADTSGISVRVDDLGDYQYAPVEGDELAFVRGPVDFTFNQFKVQPRTDEDIGTSAVTIGQARNRPVGETVTLQGVVTVPSGLFDAGFAMQDGSGGIFVFHEAGFADVLGLGQVVEVAGTLVNVNGRLQVVPADPATDVQVIGQAPVPPPLVWPTGEIGETSEGWLVKLEGTVTEKASDRLVLDDGSGPVDVVIAAGTGIDLSAVQVDQGATVVGLSSQFDEAPFDDGYRVLPRFQTDISPSGPAALTPTPSPTQTPTTVTINPSSSTVSLNGTATSSVQVVDVAGLYGVEFHIEFDPSIVQVVDADPERAGVQVMPAPLLTSQNHFVPVNRADNNVGTIDFAASLLNPAEPIDEGGDVVAITWRGVSPGTSDVHLVGAELSDQDGGAIPATLEDGSITVLEVTATPTVSPTPTVTPTPEVVPTPACDGGLCGGTLVVRAFYDFQCDGTFNAGVDRGIGGAQAVLEYSNGARVVAETANHNSGFAYFNGVNLPDGSTATLFIEWPAAANEGLVPCSNSRQTRILSADDFALGYRTVHFRATRTR